MKLSVYINNIYIHITCLKKRYMINIKIYLLNNMYIFGYSD